MPLRLLASLLGLALTFHSAHAQDKYVMGPESMEQKDVPKGEVTKYTWESNVFAGTTRDYWVYVPSQYDPKEPACVMVFQDGFNYQNPMGNWHATIVMDNLIHKKDLPVIIGVWGDGGHTANHGASILPDSMRWLWRDTPPAKVEANGQSHLLRIQSNHR